jgi:hypothetical protein
MSIRITKLGQDLISVSPKYFLGVMMAGAQG